MNRKTLIGFILGAALGLGLSLAPTQSFARGDDTCQARCDQRTEQCKDICDQYIKKGAQAKQACAEKCKEVRERCEKKCEE